MRVIGWIMGLFWNSLVLFGYDGYCLLLCDCSLLRFSFEVSVIFCFQTNGKGSNPSVSISKYNNLHSEKYLLCSEVTLIWITDFLKYSWEKFIKHSTT